MPPARTLADLIRIRHANRHLIDQINGNLGSALGFKKRRNEAVSKEPAVIVFVPRKVNAKWLPAGAHIPDTLYGPDDLVCPVDIVEGHDYEETYLWTQSNGLHPNPWDLALSPMRFLRTPSPLTEHQLRMREQLRGWHKTVTPGAQLAGVDNYGSRYFGTLGVFARDLHTANLGFITNQHVADSIGNLLKFPVHDGRPIGKVVKAFKYIPDEERFRDLIDEPDALFRIDCAFVELDPTITDADIDLRLPPCGPDGDVKRRQLGTPAQVNLDSMFPVGQRVLGVGRTRSIQRGTIHAFAYEHRDQWDRSIYTDFLIAGDEEGGFSAPGDSGKLIVTDDDQLRPIGLLWGGWQQRLRNSREQEKWSYGIDINVILHHLGVEIAREAQPSDLPEPTPEPLVTMQQHPKPQNPSA